MRSTTYLQLCQRLRQEAGVSGSGPVSVTGRIGIEAKLVEWVRRAWVDVQTLRRDWLFLRDSWSLTTIAGVERYPTTLEALSHVAQWDHELVLLTDGAQKIELRRIGYSDYRRNLAPQQQRPNAYCIGPDNALILSQVPDAAYAVDGECIRKPQTLTDNGDIVQLDDRYCDIVWQKALMYFAGHTEATVAYQDAASLFAASLNTLERDQLPTMSTGAGPLA